MKTGDLVETTDGHIGRISDISWQKIWAFGRRREQAVIAVELDDNHVRLYLSNQVWPYHRGMSETTPEPEPQPEPEPEDGGDEDE